MSKKVSPFVKLTKDQIKHKIEFLNQYTYAQNAATGSKLDANANVSQKNVATRAAELNKDINIQINREIMYNRIDSLFGSEFADEYIRQIESHEIYVHDETSPYPYTYASSEAIHVKLNGKKLVTTFKNLYSILNNEEILLDYNKIVYAKYPENLYVQDKDGYVKVTRVIRKKRHRELVRIKTAFGEDIIVTDNHPMIVNNDINDTTPADQSLNCKQFKYQHSYTFENNHIINACDFCTEFDDYDSYLLNHIKNHKLCNINKNITLTEEFGYFVGYFVAEGAYITGTNIISISQNDEKVLRQLSKFLYNSTGIASKVYLEEQSPSHKGRNPRYVLTVTNKFLVELLNKYFMIDHYAQNKTIPANILETNYEFAKGVMAGIIDGDGSANGTSVSIRLSSRAAISQLNILARALGFTSTNTYQCQEVTKDTQFKTAYPIFGISVTYTDNIKLMSFKYNKCTSPKSSKYQTGWVTITNIDNISNDAYLAQNEFIYDITTESHTFICNNIYVHNCSAVSLYPLLIDGLRSLGGESGPPTHLRSFTGSFVNLIYMVSSQFAGAVAAVETLMYLDHFAKKDLGENYLLDPFKTKIVENELQYIFYTLNQPAAARGNQSVFFNLTVYDENYFNSLFESFYFPDGSRPEWESVKQLQMFFLKWLRAERTRAILTFPVVTAALLIDKGTGKCIDTEFMEFLSEELSLGNSFFVYMSDSADSLSSCCRLRNENNDNTFSHSMGAGGVATGSINVITINLNRLIQDIANGKRDTIQDEIDKVIKYQVAYRKNVETDLAAGMMPVYDAGYITLDKQFLTIGVNGIVEAAEFLGIEPSNNTKYINWCKDILKEIDIAVKRANKNFGYKFNVEFVPAENLGVKNSEWDKKDGYIVNRDCYNSYFYVVEDENTTEIDKFIMHGREVTQYLSGGSALHLNLSAYPTKESAIKLFELAGKTGCNYWCTNILITYCETCHNIDLNTLHECPKCKSRDVSHATRVIGYLKKIKNFSKARQKESALRVYH